MKQVLRGTAVTVALLVAYALAAVLVPGVAHGFDESPLRLEDSDFDEHPEVTLIVSVPTELVGVEIPTDSFIVLENGAPAEATVEAVPSDDLEVVLLLDVSGSMAGNPLAAAQAAARSFIDQMPRGVAVAVVTFSDTTAVASTFTADGDSTESALVGLVAAGETALYDGLVAAAEQFDPSSPARRTIILLSDGGDTVSAGTLETALVAMLNKGVSFYAIELQTPENDPEALSRLAAATDGAVVAATDPDALQGIFAEIAAQLTNQYRLSYRSSTFGPTEVTVAVEVDGTSASISRTLRFPQAPTAPVATTVAPEPVAEPNTPSVRPGSLVQLAFGEQPAALYLGLMLLAAALFAGVFSAARMRRTGNPILAGLAQRGDGSAPGASRLSRLAEQAVALADLSIQGERRERLNPLLEQAGIFTRPGEFVLLAVIATIVGLAVGYLIFDLPGALAGAILALAVVRFIVKRKAEKRKAAFAEQLPDTLHLIAGSLRSGFGLLQAIEVVSAEAPSPTAEEFQRVKVEIHLGRDMDEALKAMAARVGSDDFEWVIDGITIHREVGGDVAEIIDSVNATIRARDRIRRRIRSLSVEGRYSAVILIGLPIALAAFLTLARPEYIGELTTSSIGRILIVGSVIGMVVGVVWIRRIVRVEF